MRIKDICEEAVGLLLPPACPICGKPKTYVDGSFPCICNECKNVISYVDEPVCLLCGKRVADDSVIYCSDCESHKHFYDQATAVYDYSNNIKDSIYRFKYYNKREYAKAYASEIATHKKDIIRFWNPDAIIPVPIHRNKLRIRKFNQAELMAIELGRLLSIPVLENGLIRSKETIPMKELSNTDRIKNLENAFQVNKKVVKYKKLMVVDDIYTTGSTLDACAKALKAIGAESVYCVTLCIGEGF